MQRTRNHQHRNSAGFTLVELMVVVALVALVLTQGIPWLETVTLNARRTATTNSFVAHLNSARNFAIAGDDEPDNPCDTGNPATFCEVVMCKSIDLETCSTSSSVGWHDGWIMFWDADDDQTFDSGTTERLIRVHEALKGDATLFGNTFVRNAISFDAAGMLGSNAGTLIYCDGRGFTSDARAIIASSVGRIRTLEATDGEVGPNSCTP